MSNTSNLKIAVNNVNRLLGELFGDVRIRVSTSYNRKRLYLDEGDHTRDLYIVGPRDCLMYAEGMEKALEMVAYRKEEA